MERWGLRCLLVLLVVIGACLFVNLFDVLKDQQAGPMVQAEPAWLTKARGESARSTAAYSRELNRLTLLAESLQDQLAAQTALLTKYDELLKVQTACQPATQLNITAMQDRMMTMRKEYGKLSCECKQIGPTGGFCSTKEEANKGQAQCLPMPMVRNMEELFGEGSTLVDFGCGVGQYGRAFEESGKVKWVGYDGGEGIEEATDNYVKFMDLSMEFQLPTTFDWVMSLEVGEHVPKEFEDILLGNYVRHARVGVVLSWAIEGQHGHHHVNTRNNDYIKGKMAKLGFDSDEAWEKKLRSDVGECYWFGASVMVFRKSS